MNTNEAIDFTMKALEWRERQDPGRLTKEINETMERLINKEMLEKKHRILIGFCLFTYSMELGPSSFNDVASAGAELGVGPDIEYYADDYRSYAANAKSNAHEI